MHHHRDATVAAVLGTSLGKGSAVMRGEQEELMRRLALNDEQTVASVLGARGGVARWSELDAKRQALSKVAALIALGADPVSYDLAVELACDGGGTAEEIIGVLLAVAPVVGVARLNSAAAALAVGLGCDIDVPGGA